MSTSASARTEESPGGFDFDIRELERGGHGRAERQHFAERVDRVPDAQLLSEVHEAAALRVDRAASVGELANCGRRARVLGKLLGMELGIAATHVKPIQIWW